MHKLHCYLKFGIFMLAAITFGFASVVAEVINVPGDQPSINQGLYAASYGDTVLVAAGTAPDIAGFPGKEGEPDYPGMKPKEAGFDIFKGNGMFAGT